MEVPNPYEMRVEPRQFGAVLGHAMNILARVWKPLVTTALLVFVPLGLATLAVFNITGGLELVDVVINDPASLDAYGEEEFLALAVPFFWAVGISLVLQAFASLYLYLASHRIVAADIAGVTLTGVEARRGATSRFLPALVAGLAVLIGIAALLGIGLGIWLIPFVVVGTPNPASVLVALVLLVAVAAPAIWLSVSFSMLTSVIALEDGGPLRALRRSYRLVRRRWWPTLGYLLLVGLMGSVAVQLIQVLAVPLTVIGDSASGMTLASLVGVVFQGVLVAGIGAAYTVWYVDLRARFEELTTEDLRI